jgi:outer membrane protein assembly factor BamA
VLLIERIDVTGNTATQEAVIRRALPIAAGDVLRASDPRLREARFKLLALGFFRDVALAMHKGSVRGQVVVGVRVVERGTIVLNRLWLGTSALSPTWLGADVSERNLLGLGIGVGGGFVYSSAGAVAGARSQWALELRGAEPSVLGTRWGVQGAITLVRGSEPYRVSGEGAEPALGDLRAFSYRRFGARAGAVYNATALTRLGGSVRVEQITASLPVAPVRELPDGRAAPIDLHLEPGDSRVVTAGLSFDRDTRPDPILPHSGSRLAVSAEVGARALGSEYQYAALLGRYERHWPLLRERHAIALKLAGGVVLGRAPQPDRIHVADVNRMLTPRALGLVLSAAAPLDVLGTRAEKATYGDVGGAASVEYSLELFRGRGSRRVYGGDLYVAVGAWGLAGSGELRARDTSLWRALPIDLFADAGLRIDTDIGIFEVAIANGLGRLR